MSQGVTQASGVTAAGVSSTATPAQSTIPQSVLAYAGNTTATVTWNPPLAGNPFSYAVTASPGGATTTVSGTTATLTGLTNGTAYTITVVANNAYGSSSPATANVVTPTAASSSLTGITTANLFAWYAADQLVSPPTNGNPLISGSGGTGIFWNDASGNGRHVTISNAMPTMTTSWTNSKPALTFNGSTQYLQLPFTTQNWNGQCSMLIVGTIAAIAASDTHIVANESFNGTVFEAASQRFTIDCFGDGSTYSQSRIILPPANVYSGSGNDNASGVTSMKANIPFVISVVFGAANGGGYQYFNGNKVNSNLNVISSLINPIFIGARGNVANISRFFNGKIGEIGFWSGAWSDTDRHSIEAYAGTKYNVTMAVQ